MSDVRATFKMISKTHIQIAFSKGWGEILKVAPTPDVWLQFNSFIHDKSLHLIGEPDSVWLDACYQFGIELARIMKILV